MALISPSRLPRQCDTAVWWHYQQQYDEQGRQQNLHQLHWTLHFVYGRVLPEHGTSGDEWDLAAGGGRENTSCHQFHPDNLRWGLQGAPQYSLPQGKGAGQSALVCPREIQDQECNLGSDLPSGERVSTLMWTTKHSLKTKKKIRVDWKGAKHLSPSAAVRTDELSRAHNDGRTCVDRLFLNFVYYCTSTKAALLQQEISTTCKQSWAGENDCILVVVTFNLFL